MRYPLFLAVLVFAAACKDTTQPPPPDPMIGDYPLRTIDGNQPPQIVAQDSSGRFSIVAGMVRLKEDKSFIDSTDLQLVSSTGQVSTSSDVGRGTWRLSNDTLFLSPIGSTAYYMVVTVNGIELTQAFLLDAAGPAILLVYRK